MIEKRSQKFYMAILALTVLLLYGVTLTNGFVWDDNVYLVGNRTYQDFDLQKIFLTNANGVEYLPLRDITYALDYALWGQNPFGFHLSNILFFLLNVILVFLFAAELQSACPDSLDGSLPAFLTAFFFATHPIMCESVNFITCRNVLLSGVAFFGGVLLFAKYLRTDGQSFPWSAHLLIPTCFLAALLSKATSIVLPLVLTLLSFTIPSIKSVRQKVLLLTPLFVMAGLFFFFFRMVATKSHIIKESPTYLLSEKIATAIQIPYFYLQKLVIPLGYSAEYSASTLSVNIISPATTVSFLVMLALAAAAFFLRHQFRSGSFSFLWYLITLLPVLNFYATTPIVADRYAYLPSFAFSFLLGSLVTLLARRHPRTLPAIVATFAFAFGGACFGRSLDWRTDTTLWEANIKTEPGNAKGYLNLIAEEIPKGNFARAQELLTEGRAAAPTPTFDYLEGSMYYLQGDLAKALEFFTRTLQQDSNHIRSLLNSGRIYQEMGDYEKAAHYYRQTIAAEASDGWGCREQAREGLVSVERLQTKAVY